MEAFFPIVVLLVFALIVSGAIYALTTILGPRKTPATKLSVYECGVTPEGGAHTPFKSRFYLIAVLFLLFDVEAAFFLPWALIYRECLKDGFAILGALLAYMGFMVLGLVYVIRKKALELA